jgi:Spy/CpxP family protein refolding chaperone
MIALILLVAAALLIPTVAVLHAVDTSTGDTTTDHDGNHQDHDQNHQDHDDKETSDDNSLTHTDVDDANEDTTDSD